MLLICEAILEWQTARSYIQNTKWYKMYVIPYTILWYFVYCIYGIYWLLSTFMYLPLTIIRSLCFVCQITAPTAAISLVEWASLEDRHAFACDSRWCMPWSGARSTWPMGTGFALWICGGIWWVNWNGNYRKWSEPVSHQDVQELCPDELPSNPKDSDRP